MKLPSVTAFYIPTWNFMGEFTSSLSRDVFPAFFDGDEFALNFQPLHPDTR